MTIPPKFSDIGKSASDLLSKDYPIGSTKLEVKTSASNGVNFTVTGSQDSKTGSIAGDLKTKFSVKEQGLTVTETWSTSNVLSGEVEWADSLVKGLKLNLFGSLLPTSGSKNAKVGVEFKREYWFSNASLDVFKGPSASADVSVGADGYVAGAEVSYNVQDGKISKYSAAIGFSNSDYSIAIHGLNNLTTFSASYYHKVSSDLEAGAKAVWDQKSAASNVALEVGGKYAFDKTSFAKAKINNNGILGLGFTQSLRPGVKVSLGGSFDTAKLNENVHKLGLSLNLEA